MRTRERDNFVSWMNRGALGLVGLVLLLNGAVLLGLGGTRGFGSPVGFVVTLAASGMLVIAGARQIQRAVTGHLPIWYRDFLMYTAGVIVTGRPRPKK